MKKEIESFDSDIIAGEGNNQDYCVCPECGYETTKRKGLPCQRTKCPVCDTVLVGK